MAKSKGTAAALAARAANYGGTAGGVPLQGGNPSPLSMYQEWALGAPGGEQASLMLPRDWQTFLSGAFGPLTPIKPAPIDVSEEDSGRPEPRRMVYPVGWNLPTGTPGTEGLKMASFQQLRFYSDAYSIARSAIEARKQEILGLDWDIVPTADAEKAMRNKPNAYADFTKRRAQAVKFFNRPDSNYHDYHVWLGALMDDLFSIDAMAIYMHPPRKAGKGPFGSDLASLDLIAGDTIRPLLDIRGGSPRPPNPAFQQYLWGVPRTDLMDVIMETDLDGMTEPVEAYRADQLLYLPYTRRTWTPYGFSCTERAILPIATGMARQKWTIEWFSEGTIPGLFVTPGPDVSTPDQIMQLQETLNAVAGDTAWKHRIIVLPPGSRTEPQKNISLADQFDEVLYTQVLMAFDVMPMELGISPKVSAVQSPGASNQMAKAQADVHERKALKPLLWYLKRSIFDFILQQVFKQEDMEWSWVGLEQGDDIQQKTEVLVSQVGNALRSIDEARVELGMAPWGLPETSEPIFVTPTGPVPVQGGITAGNAFGVPTPGAKPGEAPATMQSSTGATPLSPAPAAEPVKKPAARPALNAATGGIAPPAGTPAHAGAAAAHKPGPSGAKKPAAKPKPTAAATASKKMYDEAKGLERALKRGKILDDWKPANFPVEVWDMITKADDPVMEARRQAYLTKTIGTREAVISKVVPAVAADLHVLASQLKAGNLSVPAFVDQGVATMANGYTSVYTEGSTAAANQFGIPSDVIPDFTDAIDARAGLTADAVTGEGQRGFLSGLATDILAAETLDDLGNRFDLYGSTMVPAYEEAFGSTVQAFSDASPDNPQYEIVWNAIGDKGTCDFCSNNDNQSFTFDTLPGWPGDGDFSSGDDGSSCSGGMLCRCTLDYKEAGETQSTADNTAAEAGADWVDYGQEQQPIRQEAVASDRADFVDSLPDGPAASAMSRDTATADIASQQGVEFEDVSAQDVADMLAAGVRPSLVKIFLTGAAKANPEGINQYSGGGGAGTVEGIHQTGRSLASTGYDGSAAHVHAAADALASGDKESAKFHLDQAQSNMGDSVRGHTFSNEIQSHRDAIGKTVKDFTATSPLASGLVPYDLSGAPRCPRCHRALVDGECPVSHSDSKTVYAAIPSSMAADLTAGDLLTDEHPIGFYPVPPDYEDTVIVELELDGDGPEEFPGGTAFVVTSNDGRVKLRLQES